MTRAQRSRMESTEMAQGSPFKDEVVNAAVGAAEAALELAGKFPKFPQTVEIRVRFGPNVKSATVGIYDTNELEYINTMEGYL